MQKHDRLILIGFASVCVLFLIGGQTFAQRSADPFADVDTEGPYGEAIMHYAVLDVLRGYQNGLFGPGDVLTRAQASLMLYRYEKRLFSPLYVQMQEVRAALDLDVCGNGRVGTGEECDDGNTTSGDGCSAQCQQELLQTGCAGGYRFGESFAAADGCNTCICTQAGIVCTEIACPACDPIVCDDGTEYPSCSDDGHPLNYLVDPCQSVSEEPAVPMTPAPPRCGNGVCEEHENELPPDRRFNCPQDCTGEEYQTQCEDLKQEFLDMAAKPSNRECLTTVDCFKVQQSCPYITCGVAVSKSKYPNIALKLRALMDTCRQEGNIAQCVTCNYSAAYCENGQCVLRGVSQ